MTGRGECARVSEALDLYLDRELQPAGMEEIWRHLEECPECAREAAERGAFRERLRNAVQTEEVPAGLISGIDAKIRSAPRRHGRYGNGALIAFAAAAVLALGVAAWRLERTRSTELSRSAFLEQVSTGVAQIMRVGLNDHVHCAVFRKYPPQPASLAEMTRLLGPEYADLEPVFAAHIPAGTQVVMAHHCAYRGRRYVHLIARGGGKLISLMISRREGGEAFENGLRAAANEGGTLIFASAAEQFSIAGFETRDHLVYLISDVGRSENTSMLETMTAQMREILGKTERQAANLPLIYARFGKLFSSPPPVETERDPGF